VTKVHGFAKGTSLAAWVLLFAGGLVTSTGSSLSVPDWPLSFGQAMPPMLGGVRFEHGHRMIAGVVALLTWSMTAWIAATEERPWVKKLAYAASGLILLQALLGGLTVILRLPPAVSISHACLGQAVFCLVVAVAQATSPWYARRTPAPSRMAVLAFAALYLQLVLGALLRHTGQGLMLHMAWAVVAAVVVIAAAARGVHEKDLEGPSMTLAALIAAQLLLGFLSWKLRFAPGFERGVSHSSLIITAHLAVGALLLGTATIYGMRTK
jgi:cytochrome c oxidase assembly protein subunit 15